MPSISGRWQSMGNGEAIQVEVAYALPDEQFLRSLRVPAGTTVADAIERSGIRERFPDVDPGGRNKVGIFGKITRMTQVLREGDRVEIYRPLIADPKEIRKQRAAAGKRMKRGGGDLEPGGS